MKYLLIAAIFLSSWCYANHSKVLNLQLPDKVIAIRFEDIEQLQVFPLDKNHSAIMMILKTQAADRLTALTQKAVGQPVTWIWDGRVLAIEKLKFPIGKDLSVPNFSNQEAEDFKQHIATNQE